LEANFAQNISNWGERLPASNPKKKAGFEHMNKKIPLILVLSAFIISIAGCSTIKGYLSPSTSTTKKNKPEKQYCTVLTKMVKASKGAGQIGPGTSIADASRALQRMDDAYSDLEKFSTNNPEFNTTDAAAAYRTFKQAVPTLSGEGEIGDPANQIRTALDTYTVAMNDLVAKGCPTK
jgi:hypothetical protein